MSRGERSPSHYRMCVLAIGGGARETTGTLAALRLCSKL